MSDVGVEADTAARLGEWLLDMGFPVAVPRDHLLTICRGNYHAVWESLMKQVFPRSLVRTRRLQVFAADINRCRSFDDELHEKIGAVVPPEELEVWRETQSLREQVARAEARIASAKSGVQALISSVSSKVSHRERLNQDVCDAQRRQNVLQSASEQLSTRAEKLAEMTRITDRLSPALPNTQDHQNANQTVDKCMAILSELSTRRHGDRTRNEVSYKAIGQFNSTALSDVSMLSEGERPEREQANNTQEKLIELLEKISASDLWGALQEKQKHLLRKVAEDAASIPKAAISGDGLAQSCIAESSAMHCMLTLQALANKKFTVAQEKVLLKLMRVATVCTGGEAGVGQEAQRELLVLKCEEAACRSRVAVLQKEIQALRTRSGVYDFLGQSSSDEGTCGVEAVLAEISAVDREIVSKKLETEALLLSVERTSGKIASVVAKLEALFRSGRSSLNAGDAPPKHELSVQSNYDEFLQHFRPGTEDKITSPGLMELKEFFYTPPSDKSPQLELSFHLDNSDRSGADAREGPRASEEIRMFLNKFKLHVNRKLILQSGESLWISETLQRSDPHEYCSASYALALSVVRMEVLCRLSEQRERCMRTRETLGWMAPLKIDITSLVKSGSERMERTKKGVRDIATSLKQTSALLDLGLENLAWWAGGNPKKCINESRTVEGKTFNDYDNMYIEYTNDRFEMRF